MNRSFNKSQTLRYLECSAVEVKSKVSAAAAAAAAGTGAGRAGATSAAARSFVSPPAPPALGVPGRSGKRPPPPCYLGTAVVGSPVLQPPCSRAGGKKPQTWPAGWEGGAPSFLGCPHGWHWGLQPQAGSELRNGGWAPGAGRSAGAGFRGFKGVQGKADGKGPRKGTVPVGASCPGGAGDPTATSPRTGGLGASPWKRRPLLQIGWTRGNKQTNRRKKKKSKIKSEINPTNRRAAFGSQPPQPWAAAVL